ncbi:hypothetical protein Amsp01_029280 [Amycolatopsis sp. NBRC 101858]|nr:hypothetical protein Amsp01_029280 [Amycolatopsis sp. NBRC 101858]
MLAEVDDAVGGRGGLAQDAGGGQVAGDRGRAQPGEHPRRRVAARQGAHLVTVPPERPDRRTADVPEPPVRKTFIAGPFVVVSGSLPTLGAADARVQDPFRSL